MFSRRKVVKMLMKVLRAAYSYYNVCNALGSNKSGFILFKKDLSSKGPFFMRSRITMHMNFNLYALFILMEGCGNIKAYL